MTTSNDEHDERRDALSRRRMIGGAALAGGVAWAAPTLLTVPAAAAQSGGPPVAPGTAMVAENTFSGTEVNLSLADLPGPGVLIAIATAGTSTAPTTVDPAWSPLAADSGSSSRIDVYTQVVPAAVATAAFSLTYAAATPSAAQLLFFPDATAWEPVPPSILTGTGQYPVTPSLTTTGPNRKALWIGAWRNSTPNVFPSTDPDNIIYSLVEWTRHGGTVPDVTLQTSTLDLPTATTQIMNVVNITTSAKWFTLHLALYV